MPQPETNTKTLLVTGAGDDTFQWTYPGQTGQDDHDDCAKGSVRTLHVIARRMKKCDTGHEHADPSGTVRMAITGVYGKRCLWSIGIAPINDDEPMPPWPMRWRFEDYTTVLEVDIPEDATVKLVHPDDGGEV